MSTAISSRKRSPIQRSRVGNQTNAARPAVVKSRKLTGESRSAVQPFPLKASHDAAPRPMAPELTAALDRLEKCLAEEEKTADSVSSAQENPLPQATSPAAGQLSPAERLEQATIFQTTMTLRTARKEAQPDSAPALQSQPQPQPQPAPAPLQTESKTVEIELPSPHTRLVALRRVADAFSQAVDDAVSTTLQKVAVEADRQRLLGLQSELRSSVALLREAIDQSQAQPHRVKLKAPGFMARVKSWFRGEKHRKFLEVETGINETNRDSLQRSALDVTVAAGMLYHDLNRLKLGHDLFSKAIREIDGQMTFAFLRNPG